MKTGGMSGLEKTPCGGHELHSFQQSSSISGKVYKRCEMIKKSIDKSKQKEVTGLFTSVFTSSEGKDEGKLIGQLASKLALNIDNNSIICQGVYNNDLLIGSIFFTHLKVKKNLQIYMLSPVAVQTEYQGKGIGQTLITHGLEELRKRKVNIVVTYGDPAFYAKTGFKPISESVVKAPLKLSLPFGWLGQSLTEEPIPTIEERPICVEPFNNPVYW